MEGRFPESWVPPAHVLETRRLGRLYCTLMDERRGWQQRIHAQLFHQGCPPIKALLAVAGREALVGAELSAAGRQYVDTALRRIDELSAEIEPLRAQLVNFARRQRGCRALQARQYGVGWLCAAIIWAEIGDARWFRSSDQLVRFAGLDVTVYSSDGKRSQGICRGRARRSCGGPPSRRPSVLPDTVPRITPTTTGRQPSTTARTARTRPWRWSARFCVAAITPCVSSAMPPWRCRKPDRRRRLPEMRYVRALPMNQLMPAASCLYRPAATPLLGGRPGKNERPHPSPARTPGTLGHHVAGPSSVDPDKAGRRHARRMSCAPPHSLTEAADDLNHNIFTSSRPGQVCGGSSSASRTFVLAALRGLHLGPDCGPPPKHGGPERGQTAKK